MAFSRSDKVSVNLFSIPQVATKEKKKKKKKKKKMRTTLLLFLMATFLMKRDLMAVRHFVR